MTDDEIVAASTQNRLAFADLLESLSIDQLATQSLCGKWDCATVGAHLAAAITTKTPVFAVTLLRSLGSFDKANDATARHQAKAGIATTVATIRANAASRFAPPVVGLRAPMSDVLIHYGDVARPLGLPHDPPAGHVRAALDFLSAPRAIGFVKRGSLAALRFTATDLDHSVGAGEDVSGRGVDIMMAMCGRTVALADLTGPGVATLRARLSA